jgi:uncharacterized RDD family membrane protein YckC
MKETALAIRTPEGILFELPLAGPVARLLAWCVDIAAVGAATAFVATAASLLGILSADLAQAVIVAAAFVLSIGYGIATEWLWRGQTIGKRLLRLRVVDEQGLRLLPRQVIIRNLLRAVDALPALYLVGGAALFFSRRAQRLGDLAAGTVVIRLDPPGEPDLDQVATPKYNSLRDLPHLAARLRQRVSPAEARTALQALLRREELEPAARLDLYRELAEHFRSLVAYPVATVEGLSDEAYLRNVVDVVYRRR